MFWRTFSVTLTLRRLRVEKPEEHSVSVGEEGQELTMRPSPSREVVPEQMRERLSASWRSTVTRGWWCEGELAAGWLEGG